MVLALVLTVALAISFSFLLGYNNFRHSLDIDLAEDFRQITHAIEISLTFEEGQPILRYNPNDPIFQYGNLRFRVVKANKVYIEGGGEFPSPEKPWRFTKYALANGYSLEMALDHSGHDGELKDYINSFFVSLPIAIVFTALIVWVLISQLLRPLKTLQQATYELSKQSFPKPIPIPRGNDELSKLAQSFNDMVEAVQKALERERTFTRYVSHELRTPLSTIKAQVEALQLDLMPAEQITPTLLQATQVMEKILNGLLVLNRHKEPELEAVSIKYILDSICHELDLENKERVSLPESDQLVLADEGLLKQVLSNLIGNALKYSGGVVTVSLSASNSNVSTSITDEGGGVPEELLSKLTEPFFRLNKKEKQGSGLGLALAKHIAVSLGGNLDLRNTEKGLEARLELTRF